MQRIEQTENGCVIAVLQMITGRSFDELRTSLNFEGLGLNEKRLYDYLASNGYVLDTRSRWPIGPRGPWPPEPFAPMHVCAVDVNMRWDDRMLTDENFRNAVNADAKRKNIEIPPQHVVVMDEKGVVYDPYPGSDNLKSLSCYTDVLRVVGLTRSAFSASAF